MSRRSRVWIAWETQRRSISLSHHVGAELHILDWEDRGILRYPLSLIATVRLLFRHRRGVVFVQNPSMILAAVAAFCKGILDYTLIVDRHSNFLLGGERVNALFRRPLAWMSRYSIRRADVTIVSNEELVRDFIEGRGRGFVLPDPYPTISGRAPSERKEHGGPFDILFVSTWQEDEPIREVMEVCRILGDRIRVLVSGRMKPAYRALVETKPANFVLTGFLPDDAYFDCMASVDGVMAISTRPATLCCGAYEGVVMGKPLILGDSQVTREYFSAGAVYTDSTVADLEKKIRHLLRHRDELRGEVRQFYERSAEAWMERLQALNRMIDDVR